MGIGLGISRSGLKLRYDRSYILHGRKMFSCSLFFPEIPSVNRFADMNEDILHLIFEHFDLEPGSQSPPQTRKDLLSAAKVCKAFRDLL